jgi:hypothetical protein
MNLSHFVIQELVPFITGDEHPPRRSGPQLVKLFNKYGSRDVYDEKGLPIIKDQSSQRPARKQYVEARLLSISGMPEIRALLTQVLIEAEDKAATIIEFNKLLNPEKYIVIDSHGTLSIQGGIIDRTPAVRNEAHFLDIQNRILSALDSARVSIRLVVAWFTNEILFKKLLEKSSSGIDVEIAIFDDGINKKHGVDISLLPHKKLRGRRGGLMHDKFCVIDNQIVITGSYNWTNNAEFRNDENITIERDPNQASSFSEEYRKLVN